MLKKVLLKIFWGFEEDCTYSVVETLLITLRRSLVLGVIVFLLGFPFLALNVRLQMAGMVVAFTFAGGLELLNS